MQIIYYVHSDFEIMNKPSWIRDNQWTFLCANLHVVVYVTAVFVFGRFIVINEGKRKLGFVFWLSLGWRGRSRYLWRHQCIGGRGLVQIKRVTDQFLILSDLFTLFRRQRTTLGENYDEIISLDYIYIIKKKGYWRGGFFFLFQTYVV